MNIISTIPLLFSLIFLVALGGDTDAFAHTAVASIGVVTTGDQAADNIEVQSRDNVKTRERTGDFPPQEPPIKSVARAEPFGLTAVPVESGKLSIKWTGVEADIRTESEILTRCRQGVGSCPLAAQKFLAIIADGRAHVGRARIGVINRAINLAIRPIPRGDLVQWDHWDAPLATFTIGRGDCKDYAIAKYVALRMAGIAEADLRVVIVRNLAVGEDHAVVAARLDGSWIILDSRWLALVVDVEMPYVLPLFVLDRNRVKQFVATMTANARSHD